MRATTGAISSPTRSDSASVLHNARRQERRPFASEGPSEGDKRLGCGGDRWAGPGKAGARAHKPRAHAHAAARHLLYYRPDSPNTPSESEPRTSMAVRRDGYDKEKKRHRTPGTSTPLFNELLLRHMPVPFWACPSGPHPPLRLHPADPPEQPTEPRHACALFKDPAEGLRAVRWRVKGHRAHTQQNRRRCCGGATEGERASGGARK